MTARPPRTPRLVMPGAWYREGNCRGLDPEMFFPGPNDPAAVEAAKAVCNTGPCPVRDQCLEFALANSIKHGVFGGWGEGERKRMRAEAGAGRTTRIGAGRAAAAKVASGQARYPKGPPRRRDPARPAHPVHRPPPAGGGPEAA